MREVTMYKALDGELFPTVEECREYESLIESQKQIKEFIDSDRFPYRNSAAHTTQARQVLEEFVLFVKDRNQPLPVDPE